MQIRGTRGPEWLALLACLGVFGGCDLGASAAGAGSADGAASPTGLAQDGEATAPGGSDAAGSDGGEKPGVQAKFSPPSIDFGTVNTGSCVHKTVAVSSWGEAAVAVKGLDLTELGPEFTLEWLSPALLAGQAETGGKLWILKSLLALPSYQSAGLAVRYCPTAAGKVAAAVRLLSDAGPVALAVKASGVQSAAPCIDLAQWSESALSQFGGVQLGKAEVLSPAIKSCGAETLAIVEMQLAEKPSGTAPEFKVALSGKGAGTKPGQGGISKANPLLLQPGDQAVFDVSYSPTDFGTEAQPDAATLTLTFSDGTQLVKTFTGWGVEQTCPLPVVTVLEGEEVVPQTNLHLSGTNSLAPAGGQIKKYQWTVKQPLGSNQPLLPSASFPKPTLQANAAGEYEFCLHVWDQKNVQSCIPSCTKVLVIPNDHIHIELLWDTPSDADQTDNGPVAGADLDLHFAHPLAAGLDRDCDGVGDPWFSNPSDTFWFNPNPAWGAPAITDDPSMDLDDTDGAGPENLNVQEAEGTLDTPVAYSVGVHYWNDHCHGPSYATVSIYLQGGLAIQWTKIKLMPRDLWYVGKLNWPNTMSGGSKKIFESCNQSGYSCPAGKNLMWKASGAPCITPSYDDSEFLAASGYSLPKACTPAQP